MDINKKSRAARSLKNVNLDHLEKQARTILARDIDRMLVESFSKRLSDDEAKQLCNYLKLLREMKKALKEEIADLTDEELEKISVSNNE